MTKAHRSAPAPIRRTTNLIVAPFEGFDRTASLAVPQELIDDQLAGFTEGELKILLAVLRATNGGQREAVALSVRVLCFGGLPEVLPGKGTGLSPRTVQAACAALEAGRYLRVARRMAPDGSGLPSLFTLPLQVPGVPGSGASTAPRFAGYASGRRVRLPLLVMDRLLSELSGAELKVLLYVLRHTFCLGLPDEVMAMARLVENTGLSLRHTRLAVAGLSTRGIVLVQHRQDAERGKLPSRFGVRVLGEAAPFAASVPAPGMAARTIRPEEQAEPARPVWLVPHETQERSTDTQLVEVEPLAANAILQVFPQQTTISGEAATPAPPLALASAPGAAADSRTTQSGAPSMPRSIPPTMLRDNHPAWAAVKEILARKLSYQVFMDRVATTSSVGTGGSELLVAVQDENHRWWMESKLGERVRSALTEAGYPDLRLRYLNFTGAIPVERDSR